MRWRGRPSEERSGVGPFFVGHWPAVLLQPLIHLHDAAFDAQPVAHRFSDPRTGGEILGGGSLVDGSGNVFGERDGAVLSSHAPIVALACDTPEGAPDSGTRGGSLREMETMLPMHVDDYHALCRQYPEWARTSLIDGVVYVHLADVDYHNQAVDTVRAALQVAYPSLLIHTRVRMRYGDHCSLVMDLAAFRVDPRPVPAEEPVRGAQQWAIDIFHRSGLDLQSRARVYARNQIPEYWAFCWRFGYVDRFSQPRDEGYDLELRIPIEQVVGAAREATVSDQ
jgi:hypothetical protein